MTYVSLKGFLSKKEIEVSYGRSYRSLTRDFSRAVKAGDIEVLRHLKLVTDDEVAREGTDVTLDLIQDLSNRGLQPMWLAEESWIADWCSRPSGKRGDSMSLEKSAGQRTDGSPQSSNASKTHANATSDSQDYLRQRVEDQQQQIMMLRGQLQIKDEQIRTANQLAEQSQTLMRDLHVLLKNVQDGLLGEGTRRVLAPGKAPSPSVEPAVRAHEVRPPTKQEKTVRAAKPAGGKKPRSRATQAKPQPVESNSRILERWFPTLLGNKRRGD